MRHIEWHLNIYYAVGFAFGYFFGMRSKVRDEPNYERVFAATIQGVIGLIALAAFDLIYYALGS